MQSMTASISILEKMRECSGPKSTVGLSIEEIQFFLERDPTLEIAIRDAMEYRKELEAEFGHDFFLMNEEELCKRLQSGFVNFYSAPTINPYVPLSARGPWIITSHGAVVHDNGGYGMLGFGHGPEHVIQAMSKNWVMANVMTPSFSQIRFNQRMRLELGHSRGDCPFDRFICMNSGSESVTVACRIADVNAKLLTDPGGKHEGKEIVMMAVVQGFHGRTDRPAQMSHSCLSKYVQNLASFRHRRNLILVPANDIEALQHAFQSADENNQFIELFAIEPVQGEGNPGQALDREFYDMARNLSTQHGTILLIDSIQAGLRGHGCLSLVDYPGFESCEVPDCETWSKALNAGQYPLSVLGLSPRAAELYASGIYGNTMTTNPRALEVAIAVLDSLRDGLRDNIRNRGIEFVEKLSILEDEFPDICSKVQGTGLLCSIELNQETHPVVGFHGVETWCRKRGLGVIHGGINALRFTSHLEISSEEIDLIIDILRECFTNYSVN
jgi:acetylornithine/succinyldiaminopimelate/putrescine aminotransferase